MKILHCCLACFYIDDYSYGKVLDGKGSVRVANIIKKEILNREVIL